MANRLLKYFVLLAIVLFIVAISSFWFGRASFSDRDVKLVLGGPLQASVGDEVMYKVEYINNTKTTLSDLNFLFYYPEGSTSIKNGTVFEEETEGFTVDSLEPGQKGEREFRAFIVGDKGNIKSAKIILSFKAGNLKSSFEKSDSISTTIVDMPVDLTLVSLPNATAGQNISYILDYRNESGDDISDLLFEFSYPDSFVAKSFTPLPDQGNNIWLLPALKKGAGARISIQGILNGKEGENKFINVQLKRKVDNIYINYEKASSVTVISNPVLNLSILVNDSTEYSAHPGDNLRYTIKYGNNSNFSISGLNLSVKLDGEMYDLSTLNTSGGFFDYSTKTILWSAGTVSEFVSLYPKVKGQISFSVSLKPVFTSGGSSQDRFVKTTAELRTPDVPAGIDSEELAVSTSHVTKIGTQPTFIQEAYYNDLASSSLGPLPPVAGQETFFTVHWQITNPGNDLSNVKIAGKLPAGVSWVDEANVSPGNLDKPAYNPDTQEVTWSLPTVAYGVGVNTLKYDGAFRVKIKPASSQEGSSITLLNNVKFSGTDSYTKQSIIISKKDITSNDLADRPEEGTVQ